MFFCMFFWKVFVCRSVEKDEDYEMKVFVKLSSEGFEQLESYESKPAALGAL